MNWDKYEGIGSYKTEIEKRKQIKQIILSGTGHTNPFELRPRNKRKHNISNRFFNQRPFFKLSLKCMLKEQFMHIFVLLSNKSSASSSFCSLWQLMQKLRVSKVQLDEANRSWKSRVVVFLSSARAGQWSSYESDQEPMEVTRFYITSSYIIRNLCQVFSTFNIHVFGIANGSLEKE